MEVVNDFINYLNTNFLSRVTIEQYAQASLDTLYMVAFSLILGALIGIPLAICLVTTRPSGLLENKRAESMGATPIQIIWHFMLPEAFSSLILTFTTATIGLIGATAMAGAIGAGGIGDVAYSQGYQRFDDTVIYICVAILVIAIQTVQSIGNYLARKARHE